VQESAEKAFLPEAPDELTAEWLSQALGRSVTEVRQTDLGDGQGFMGDVLRLELQGDAALPNSVVAKLPKKANRVMGELLGVYEREIMFFRDFAEEVPVRIPAVYFSEFDRDAGSEKQAEILRAIDKMPLFLSRPINYLGRKVAASKKRRYMLLIEYLEGMQPGDQLAGVDEAGCAVVMRSIAQLHRHFWGDFDASRDEGSGKHFWLLPLDIDARLRHGAFKTNLAEYAARVPSHVANLLEWLKPRGEALSRQFVADAPNTLLHCDLRLDNVVFADAECAFIDWQLVRTGPAVYDIAYFLSSALDEEAGQDVVNRLLLVYLDALGEPPGYDFSRLRKDYERALLLVLANLSGAAEVDLTNERGAAMMSAWMRRLWARLQDVDADRLI